MTEKTEVARTAPALSPLRDGRGRGRTGRLHILEPGQPVGAAAGNAVVVIPVYGALDDFAACLHSILRHTPDEVPVLVADDGTPGTALGTMLVELDAAGCLDLDVYYARAPENRGFVLNMNAAFAATAPADVVMVNSDVVVAEGWFEGLRAAAYSDTLVATATALTNSGTIVSVPYRNTPTPRLPHDLTVDDAAAAIRSASLRLYPRIVVAVGHCVYVKRQGLDLVGAFDVEFSPGYGEEVDFSMRCAQRGMSHVVADDVFVLHTGGVTFARNEARDRLIAEHERIIDMRYPLYKQIVDEQSTSRSSPLARALGAARRAMLGLSVTIDASCLGPVLTGTQLHALELIHALWEQGDVRIRVMVPRDIGAYGRRALAAMPGIEQIWSDEMHSVRERTDVVHRPFQVGTPEELAHLRMLGERVVITQQDLIAYRNPAYFRNYDAWRSYHNSVRQSLSVADSVFFFTRHAADDAITEGLVEPERAHVVYIGVDHQVATHVLQPEPPRLASAIERREAILCLGTDFHHKNRVFALQLLDEMQRRHGWQGVMVLAGAKVAEGSSAGEEARFSLGHPEADAATVRLGAITEGEKLWLLNHVKAVIYPTVYEGFGLIPFECADAGVPCVFASQSSLAEILPASAALLHPWDAAATADAIVALLGDAERSRQLVEDVRDAGQRYRWSTYGREALELYRQAAAAAPRGIPGLDIIDSPLPAVARHLVGPGGTLPPDVQQALWAITRRPQLARAFYSGMRAVHRVGFGLLEARERRRDRKGGQ